MGQEIERKFLVVNDDWRQGVKGKLLPPGLHPHCPTPAPFAFAWWKTGDI